MSAAKNVIAMDEMLMRTLAAFLEAQAKIYLDNMGEVHGTDQMLINTVQARYEVAALALSTVGRFVLRMKPEDQFPPTWQDAIGKAHDLICAAGDDWLRQRGIDPSLI